MQAQFYIEGFFETLRHSGQGTRRVLATSIKKHLAAMRAEILAADLEGNHMGIRRFATVIDDPSGKFLHLLTIAEPANADEPALVSRYSDALLQAREELVELVLIESTASRLRPKHHIMPQLGR